MLNQADVIDDQSDAVTQNAWFRCSLCAAISGEISILIQTGAESWGRFPVPRICRWESRFYDGAQEPHLVFYIVGMGHSMVLTSCFLIIPLYFDKKRARANGISSVGTSIGGMVLGPLLTILFLEFGYPGAMVIIGGMMLNLAVSGALFRPIVISPVSHTPNGGTEYGIEMKELSSNLDKLDTKVVNPSGNLETHEEEIANDKDLVAHSVGGIQDKERFSKRKICSHIFDCSVMKSKSFFGFCLANLGIFVCMSSNTFLAGLAKEKHVSDTMIALILMVTSATNCVSRIISGFLFDLNFLKKGRILIFLLLGFLAGFIMCLLPFTSSIAAIFIVNMATNIFIHAFHAQHITILCDMVGQKKMADALGIARMFMGVGWLCGPVIGGDKVFSLYDVNTIITSFIIYHCVPKFKWYQCFRNA